jgi:hypothetical protein
MFYKKGETEDEDEEQILSGIDVDDDPVDSDADEAIKTNVGKQRVPAGSGRGASSGAQSKDSKKSTANKAKGDSIIVMSDEEQ